MRVRRVDGNGDPVFGRTTSMASDSEAVAVSLGMAMHLFLGEWFLDQSAGLPWLDGTTDLSELGARIKQLILANDGVSALLAFDLILDHETRKLIIDASVSDVYGTTIPLTLVIP